MKLFSLNSTPFEPISHDPELRKKVLLKGFLPGVQHVSHAVLVPGDKGSPHSHEGLYEVIYCIQGASVFTVKDEEIIVKKGDLIIIEPGEPHAVPDILEESEFFYFKVSGKGE